MKKYVIAAVAILALGLACPASEIYEPMNGDIVFQISRSAQSRAIQLVSGSPYSHMGVVYLSDREPFVFEAVGTVKSTPMREWVARGQNRHFVVKRLVDADHRLSPEALQLMFAVGRSLEGKSYDLLFEWSDDRIYCSELVWKIYHRALGVELTVPEIIADLDLDHPEVLAVTDARWLGGPPPDQKIVSPASILDSELLVAVYRN